jgi:hypothetical protein
MLCPLVPAICLAFLCLGAPAWGGEPAGAVTSSVPEAGAVRGGKRTPLAAGDEIFVEDVLFTDEKGQLEITFEDGTTLDLGPSSEAHVRDFTMTETKNSFHSELIKGAARVVTGELVKRNPGGFKISTPRSTIGIRGTEVLSVVRGGDEILMVPVLGGRREGDAPGASDSSHVTVIDRRTGQMYRITEPGWVFTHSGRGPSRLTRPNPEKRAALDSLIRITGVPTEGVSFTPGDFNQNVDRVLEEHPEEPVRAPDMPGFSEGRRPGWSVSTPDGNVNGGNGGDSSVGDSSGGDAPGGDSSGKDASSESSPGDRADLGGGDRRQDDSWKNELPGESVIGRGDPRIRDRGDPVRIGAEPLIPSPRIPSNCD